MKPGQLNEAEVKYRAYQIVKNEERYDIYPNADQEWLKIKSKMDKQSISLNNIAKISLGIKLRANDEFISNKKNKKYPHGIVFGKDIDRYGALKVTRYFNYDDCIIVGGTKNREIHNAKPKIFVQAIRNLSLKRRIVATLDETGRYFIGTVNSVILANNKINILYVLGIINSTLINYYFSKRFTTISLTSAFLGVLPIYNVNENFSQEQRLQDKLINLVSQMLETQKKYHSAKSESDKKHYQQKIEILDKQIDELVYELYGLTKEEIKIVEGEGKK